jgi:hypothetical protein
MIEKYYIQKMLNYLTLGISLSIILLPFSGNVRPQSTALPQATLIEAEKNQAAKEEDYPNAIYRFSIGVSSYKVTGQGVLSVQSLKSHTTLAEAPLDFPKPAYIAGIRYLVFEGDLILGYDVLLVRRPIQDGDKLVEGDVLQGRVARFQRTSLKTKWVTISAASDPGPQSVAGTSMFVTGTDTIGEIDLKTGFYLWRHEHILQLNPPKYVVFKVPRIESNFVFFEEDPAFLRSRTPETIQIKRRTGEIVSMSYKSPK